MALTYYIRSWDPRSTYPTNPQEGDICYTITLDQTWAPVGGVKKDNIVKEEIYQNGAWVEQGGGGGSSLTTIYDGSFTTTEASPGFYMGNVYLSTEFPPESLPASIQVEYDGGTYTLPLANDEQYFYGEFDGDGYPVYTTYPVAVGLVLGDTDFEGMMICTSQAETNTLKASADIGGGGTPNYTTCTVTLTGLATIEDNYVYVSYLAPDNATDSRAYIDPSDSYDIEVILYKGKANGYCNEPNISVSGDIVDYGGEFVISGDCSITIGTN